MKIYTGIGSRKSPPGVIDLMRQLGYQLAKAGWGLRSGGAAGADRAFEAGCDRFGGKKSIYIPWEGFDPRDGSSKRYSSERGVCAGVSREAMDLAAKYHPNFAKCSQGAQKLHGRNSYQVLGPNLDKPSDLLICWHMGTGGTTQACRIAADYGVDIINLYEIEGKKKLARLMSELME